MKRFLAFVVTFWLSLLLVLAYRRGRRDVVEEPYPEMLPW